MNDTYVVVHIGGDTTHYIDVYGDYNYEEAQAKLNELAEQHYPDSPSATHEVDRFVPNILGDDQIVVTQKEEL
ncbi:MAG: hypothetical protein ABEN55_21100 [Bradymonadaceae bacterium]